MFKWYGSEHIYKGSPVIVETYQSLCDLEKLGVLEKCSQ